MTTAFSVPGGGEDIDKARLKFRVEATFCAERGIGICRGNSEPISDLSSRLKSTENLNNALIKRKWRSGSRLLGGCAIVFYLCNVETMRCCWSCMMPPGGDIRMRILSPPPSQKKRSALMPESAARWWGAKNQRETGRNASSGMGRRSVCAPPWGPRFHSSLRVPSALSP